MVLWYYWELQKFQDEENVLRYQCKRIYLGTGEMSQWLSAHFTRVGTRAYIPRAHINPGQCGSHLVIPTFGRQMLVIPQANWLAPDSSEIPASMSEVESNWERPLAPASASIHCIWGVHFSWVYSCTYTHVPHISKSTYSHEVWGKKKEQCVLN